MSHGQEQASAHLQLVRETSGNTPSLARSVVLGLVPGYHDLAPTSLVGPPRGTEKRKLCHLPRPSWLLPTPGRTFWKVMTALGAQWVLTGCSRKDLDTTLGGALLLSLWYTLQVKAAVALRGQTLP